MPMKSAAVFEGESERLGFRVIRLRPGLKNAAQLPPLSETVMVPTATHPSSMTLELDELWSFVEKKTNQAWVWIALCRRTRQVVAYAIGDRSQATRALACGRPLLHRFLSGLPK